MGGHENFYIKDMELKKANIHKMHGNRMVRVYVDGNYARVTTWADIRRRCAPHSLATYNLIDIEADPADIPCVHVITNSTTR